MYGLQHSAVLLYRSGAWCKHTDTHTFPLLDIPAGELIPQETVAINEVGMAVEWEGMEEKKGREQTGDTNEV